MSGKVKDTHLPVTIKNQEIVYQGFREVVSYTYQENLSGVVGSRELVNCRNSVAVVAFDPSLQKLVMIRQYRLGAALGTGRGMTAEIVAGMIDYGEKPI